MPLFVSDFLLTEFENCPFFYEKFSQGINHGYFENSYNESLEFSILANICQTSASIF